MSKKMSKSDNLYQFSVECFVDISKIIGSWDKSLVRIVSVKEDEFCFDYTVVIRVDNTDLVQFTDFLKGIEEDMDTHVATETIVKL